MTLCGKNLKEIIMLNLYLKLIEIRKTVEFIKKDTEGFKYSYVSGAHLLLKLREKMDELNVLLVPNIISYKTMYANKLAIIECEMRMDWINADNPEEKLEVPFACFGSQNDISKAFGSALTYSERYFLLKFFNIPTDSSDPDSSQKKQPTDYSTNTPSVLATSDQIKTLKHYIKISNVEKELIDQWLKAAKVDHIELLEADKMESCIKYLKKKMEDK